MSDSELEALARSARRRERLGADARCGVCGTDRHPVRRPDGRVLCYEDSLAERDMRVSESHHVAGRANVGGLLVELWANDHRTVTELSQRLGVGDWPDADGDPLLILAHFLAGLATLLALVAEWLVDIAAYVADSLGAEGWDGVRRLPIVP